MNLRRPNSQVPNAVLAAFEARRRTEPSANELEDMLNDINIELSKIEGGEDVAEDYDLSRYKLRREIWQVGSEEEDGVSDEVDATRPPPDPPPRFAMYVDGSPVTPVDIDNPQRRSETLGNSESPFWRKAEDAEIK